MIVIIGCGLSIVANILLPEIYRHYNDYNMKYQYFSKRLEEELKNREQYQRIGLDESKYDDVIAYMVHMRNKYSRLCKMPWIVASQDPPEPMSPPMPPECVGKGYPE